MSKKPKSAREQELADLADEYGFIRLEIARLEQREKKLRALLNDQMVKGEVEGSRWRVKRYMTGGGYIVDPKRVRKYVTDRIWALCLKSRKRGVSFRVYDKLQQSVTAKHT